MDKRIVSLIALFAILAPVYAAATIAISPSYGCGDNLDTITLVATGLNETNVTALLWNGAVADTSYVIWTACDTGVYVNSTYVTADASGEVNCTVQFVTDDYGTHRIGVNSTTETTGASTTLNVKCYEVTDLVYQGVDIAGNFMNELVNQSGNIAALVILGLIVTLLVGLIAAVGTIFVVFKLR